MCDADLVALAGGSVHSSLTKTAQNPGKGGIVTPALKMAELKHRVTFPRSHSQEEAGTREEAGKAGRTLRFDFPQSPLIFLPLP